MANGKLKGLQGKAPLSKSVLRVLEPLHPYKWAMISLNAEGPTKQVRPESADPQLNSQTLLKWWSTLLIWGSNFQLQYATGCSWPLAPCWLNTTLTLPIPGWPTKGWSSMLIKTSVCSSISQEPELIYHHLRINLTGSQIEQVFSFKLLGVVVNDILTYSLTTSAILLPKCPVVWTYSGIFRGFFHVLSWPYTLILTLCLWLITVM